MVIACDLHDVFELVCMRAAHVELVLRSGQTCSGVADDLVVREGEEYLLLRDNPELWPLTAIVELKAGGAQMTDTIHIRLP